MSDPQQTPAPAPPLPVVPDSLDAIALPDRRENRSYQLLCHQSDRDRWLRDRETGIGASEIATILGKNPHESAFTLYQRRVGVLAPKEGTPAMDWGKRLEAAIAQAFQDETGRTVQPAGYMRRSGEYPWLIATPDFSWHEARADGSSAPDAIGLLECKGTDPKYAEEWAEDAPLRHQLQLQHQLLVTGWARGSIACFIWGKPLRWKDYAEHLRMQAVIVRRSWEFWQRLRGKLPAPRADDHPSTSATLMRMVESGEAVQLSDEALRWHQEAVKCAEQERDAKERKEEYRRKIRAAIGTAPYGILPNDAGAYKFATVHRKEHVVQASSSRELHYLTSKWSVVPS